MHMIPILIAATIFTAPEGWRARLDTIDPAKVAWIVVTADASPCGPGSARQMRVIDADQDHLWLSCDVKLEGQTIEIWRDTRALIEFPDGRVFQSSRIIAALDPCGREYLMDNHVAPFVVGSYIFGYEDGTARLYMRFERTFDVAWLDGASWRLVNYHAKD
jgi:hypothetical protein